MLQTTDFQSKEQTNLKTSDPEIYGWIQKEEKRQIHGLELIASENYVSRSVMEAQGSILTNKYAEGYPGKRYYGGCEFVDEIESIAIQRACDLFGVEHANVQPHSGSQANMAVYMAALKLGDKVLGMDLSNGGHLTHGSSVNFSGKLYEFLSYGLNSKTHRLDYDQVRDVAKKENPKLIIAGYSAYPRELDFKLFKEIADEVGAELLVDMSHFAGLVVGGVHPSPAPYADYITTTTHKTLRGPRGGMILTSAEKAKKLNSQIFPGIQGGPMEHTIGAKAVAFKEAQAPSFKTYAEQIVKNAQALSSSLLDNGFDLVTGGTDNHLLLVDLTSLGDLTGKVAEKVLDQAHITVNKNTVPNETRSPFVTSGIRLGTPALTTRGFKENDMIEVGQWISDVLKTPTDTVINKVKSQVMDKTQNFPLPS